jgi:hypothetical protein
MEASPMAPKIMVIRHAEKPAKSGEPYGINSHGNKHSESLTVEGWQRAGALVCLFAPTHGPLQHAELATPRFLYASGIGHHSHSKRSQETITPLSAKIGHQINTHYHKDKYESMVSHALKCDAAVLICWEHQDIPGIANKILGNTTTAPQKWLEHRFDMVWVFDLDSAEGTYTFHQVPQCLLAGDSPTILTQPGQAG